jgi:endonuclease III
VLQSGVTIELGSISSGELKNRRAKALKVEEILTKFYGPRDHSLDAYDQDLLGALIATVLSQHTSDINSGRAFLSLKKTFPGGWGDVMDADELAVANSIRHGGLANIKAKRIQNLIREVVDRTGSANLDVLRSMDGDLEKLEFLKSFKGVGPKTAACILCFNMGRQVIPVDTHVHRVSRRLGLIGEKTSADQAHDDLLEIAPANFAYSFHVHLIEHGRQICHARNPKCSICPVEPICDKVGL